MECPNCHKNASRVIDSRPSDENRAIRRRRDAKIVVFALLLLKE